MAQKKDQKTGKWYFYGKYKKDGVFKNYKKRGFKTKREAVLAEEKFLLELTRSQNNITLSQLMDKYLANAKTQVKESTVDNNQGALKKWVRKFGDMYVSEITRAELQDFVDELDARYSKRYVEKIFYCGNTMFNYGLTKELIDKNPLTGVERDKRPNEMKKEMLFWEPDEFEKFIANVDDIMWKTFFSTLYMMGIRRGECIALTWKDIDFVKKTMSIYKTSSAKQRNKKVKYTTPKTKNSYRIITIPDALLSLLKEWKSVESTFSGFSENSFVFGNDLPLPAENIRRNFIRYIKLTNDKLRDEEKIQQIRIHDLRHSHASYLINNMEKGFSDYDIAKRLGDTLETLHNTYAHWFKTKDSKIIDFMNMDINLDQNKNS
nr:MAG TPA: Integrase [Caudoviricetes sp.]